ncbi:MAG: NADH-quinone oxidoreductase subunit L [Chloroflexota bacterium]
MTPEIAWLIFLLPLFSFIIISLVIRPFLNHQPKLAGYTTIAAIGGSFLLSLWALFTVMATEGHALPVSEFGWIEIGKLQLKLGFTIDSLTAIMLIVVTGVSFLIQIYSQGYMRGDPGYPRYYASMSLFTASMLGLVLASNLIMVYFFWEGVGLCSYLLIGFWFQKPAAANAAKKAFIVTRLGDFGFLLAILFLITNYNTVDIAELHKMALAGALGGSALTFAAIGVFCGAVGKSAQFPLHVWLPDAMEGPTPVSALIHAATMVAAGVYLVARLFPVFASSETAMTTVAIIGGITAVLAASMGLVMNDFKRVLAYSTISQLGYMMLALGVGGYVAGVFHLMNHAFFKALLFLTAGSANHSTGTFDIREMGGLRKIMPWTFATFLIASLSIAGIPPFSGFWSKDEILLEAFHRNQPLFWLALAGAFMTAFYMFRLCFIAFFGKYRGSTTAENGGHGGHGGHGPSLHESPAVMTLPLIILAIPAIISGFVNPPKFLAPVIGIPAHWFGHFLETEAVYKTLEHHGSAPEFDFGMAALSSVVALAGIALAYLMYSAKVISAESVGNALKPLHTLISRKYFFDELYEDIIVRKVFVRFICGVIINNFDKYFVDGIANGIGGSFVGGGVGGANRSMGQILGRLQSGQVQAYGLAIFIGILLIVAAFLTSSA